MSSATVTKQTLTLPEVAQRFGVSQGTVRNWVRQRRRNFPLPLACSPHKLLWTTSSIDRALELSK
jgi:predicted DNA-binding transcriptional regulator AlpA